MKDCDDRVVPLVVSVCVCVYNTTRARSHFLHHNDHFLHFYCLLLTLTGHEITLFVHYIKYESVTLTYFT